MLEIFTYSFMIRAFLAGGIIAFVAPLIGTFLVIKRFSLIADTLSHAALAGVAIALLTGGQPLLVTVIVTIIVSLVIDRLRFSKGIPAEAVLAMFLPGGLAISLVLISLANGFNVNLFSYLFGSITTVKPEEIVYMFVLGIVTVGLVNTYYKQFLAIAFDEDSAKVSGIKVNKMNAILMVLTAITVSLSMRVVGTLLIGALMVIPVITGMQIAKSFKQSLWLSVLFAEIAVFLGLFLAYYLNLPAGSAIVLLSLSMFSVIAVFKNH